MTDSGPAFADSVPTNAGLVETGPAAGDAPHVTGPNPATAPTPQPAPMAPPPTRRPPVSYQPSEVGWWLASDGLWYPPESVPGAPAANAAPSALTHPQQVSQPAVVHAAAPQVHPGHAAPVSGPPKSKMVAGLLGIFLGAFGAHRFYLGNMRGGRVMLVMTVLSLGLLAPLTAFWGLIEGILILCGVRKTDARGIPLQ